MVLDFYMFYMNALPQFKATVYRTAARQVFQNSLFLILLIGLGITGPIAAFGTIAGAEYTLSAPKRINFAPDRPMVPGEMLVKFRPAMFRGDLVPLDGAVQTSYPTINAIYTRLQVKSMTRVFRTAQDDLGDIYRLRFDTPISILDALKQMSSDPGIEWVEPNYISSIFVTPNDSLFNTQWGLTKIQAELAWGISQGSTDVAIAIIDTGVDYDHKDLEGNIWHNPGEIANNGIDDDNNGYVDDYIGWDFVSVPGTVEPAPDPGEDIGPRDNDPMDFHGHGTHCAGIASAATNNNTGIAGTAWKCKIMALRAGYKTSSGGGSLADSDTSAALHYAADNGAHVISMSWGSTGGGYTLQNAVQYALSKGSVLVAAAGNGNSDTKNYPAAYPDVIAVGASAQDDTRAIFGGNSASNYGSWVDIAAPGKSINSTTYEQTVHNDTYAFWSGTSMATPFVAGSAALIRSQNPSLSYNAVAQRLLDSADNINWDFPAPTKRLNVYRALLLGSCSIALYTPTDGEEIKGGSSYTITWQTTGNGIDHIHLQYSADGGSSYQDIVNNTFNDGTYQWNPVPAINSSTARVKAIAEDPGNFPLANDATENLTIDSTSPQTTAVLYGSTGENGWYKSDVNVTLLAADSLSGVKQTKYKINDGVWQVYSSQIVVVTSSNVYYYSEDNVGNTEAEKSVEIRIDRSTPETNLALAGTAGKNGWYTSNVTVTLTATDSISGVKWMKYRINNGLWQTYSSPFILTGSTVYYYSEDNAGNKETEKSMEIKVDKSAPETSVAPGGVTGENGWYKSDVTVALSATDNTSGVKEIRYKINDGLWQTYSSPFVLTGSTIYYHSEDNAGNTEAEKSMEIKIDKSVPETNVTLAGTEGKNGWYKSDVTVTLSATDNTSGVKETRYKINNGLWQTYSSPFIVTGSTVCYYSLDNAGNAEAEKSVEVKVDKSVPETMLALEGTVGENEWYISDVTVTLSATDSPAGVKETRYKINDGAWQTYSSPYVVAGSTIYYYSEDNAGNKEAEKFKEIKVDKSAPETGVALVGTEGANGWYVSDVTVVLSATDSSSGVRWTRYRINDDSWQTYSYPYVLTGSATYYVYYKSGDKAGNVQAEKSIEIKIDKVAPVTGATFTGTAGENGWYTSDVTVKLTATDNLSGIGETQYRINDGKWQTYTKTFRVLGSIVKYRSLDKAGNLETEQSRDIKIDNTAPSIPVVTDDGTYTNSNNQLHAVWTASSDAESGIVEYQYGIATVPDESKVSGWKSAGINTGITVNDLVLTGGQIYYIGVKAKNGAGIKSNAGFSDGIIINVPPVVGDIPDVSFPEDSSHNSIDLDDYVNDLTNADDEIKWTYTGNTSVNVSIDDTTRIVTFIALPNWNGSETISFVATDPGGLSDGHSVKATVVPVNDPPTASNLKIEPLPPVPGDELIASYIYSDVEKDSEKGSQIRWYKNGQHQPFDNLLKIPSTATFPGDEWRFTVTPSDGIDTGETKTSPSVIIGGMVQELHLYPGWNLISIYLNNGNTNLPSVLAPIDGFYGSVWWYDATTKGWKRYIPGDSLNTLNIIEPGKGYWLYIDGNEEVVLKITGKQITDTSISLQNGGNLVGYSSVNPKTRENALFSMEYVSIWTYDNATKTWLRYIVDGPEFLNNLIDLIPGNGYLIYVERSVIWTVPP